MLKKLRVRIAAAFKVKGQKVEGDPTPPLLSEATTSAPKHLNPHGLPAIAPMTLRFDAPAAGCDPSEFSRQMLAQQDELNRLTVDEYITNRDQFLLKNEAMEESTATPNPHAPEMDANATTMRFEKFLTAHPHYQFDSRPSAEFCEAYAGQVPDELIAFWKEFGFGTFMDGYLKIIPPFLFQNFMEETYDVYLRPSTVFAVTAFGDILIWEKQWIKQIKYRKGQAENQGSKITSFFNTILTKWANVGPALDAHQFLPTLERLGPCAYDECYGYFPALALGGSEKVENLQKVKLREHLSLLSQMVGVIE